MTQNNNNNCIPDVTVGRSIPLEPGQKPTNDSLSVTLSSQHPPIATFDAFKGSSEIENDLLGNSRFGTPQLLFANVRRYDIDQKIWATRVDASNQGKILFDAEKSAAKLSIQNGNFPNTYSSLQTKINFPYQPGRSIDCSYGVQFSRGAANENVVIEFGAFDSFDGYGYRIIREGGQDRMFIFRRTSSGETAGLLSREQIPYLSGMNDLMSINAYEEIIEVANTSASGYTKNVNGNRLDGSLDGATDVNGNQTVTGHKLSLFDDGLSATNLAMFRIRYSWYGASGADFWAYVPLSTTPKPGIPRWVRIHSFPIGDSLQFPSLKNPDKPLTFRIYRRADRTGVETLPSANAFLSTFGTSLSIDAGDPTPMEVYSKESANTTLQSTNNVNIMALQMKPYIASSTQTLDGTSKQTVNQLRIFPLKLNFVATSPVAFSLIKNPISLDTVFPLPVVGDLSAVDVATNLAAINSGTGKNVGTFYAGRNQSDSVDLTDAFSYNREYLAREAQAPTGTPGDSLYLLVKSLTPSKVTSEVTSSGTTATATVPLGHGLSTGDRVTISGLTPGGYNGTFAVNVTSPTQFTYTVASGLTTPATGTGTVVLNVQVSATLIWGQQ